MPGWELRLLLISLLWLGPVQGPNNGWESSQGLQQQDCRTPEGVRQVLCGRRDTSIMCRLFDTQCTGAALQLPSLGDGITMFVMTDAAISRLRYMKRDSALGQTIRALSANEIPDGKRIALCMYLQLLGAYTRENLVHHGRIQTMLSQSVQPAGQWDLTFSQTEDGQVEITSLAELSRARILDSLEVCGSLLHTVDGLILPSADNSLENIPDYLPSLSPFQAAKLNNAIPLPLDESSRVIAGAVLAGILAVLATLWVKSTWAWGIGRAYALRTAPLPSRSHAYSCKVHSLPGSDRVNSGPPSNSVEDVAPSANDLLTMRESIELAVDRAMERWTGKNPSSNSSLGTLGSKTTTETSTLATSTEEVLSPCNAWDAEPTSEPTSTGSCDAGGASSLVSSLEDPFVAVRSLLAVSGPQSTPSVPVATPLVTADRLLSDAALDKDRTATSRRQHETNIGEPGRADDTGLTWQSVQAEFDRTADKSWQLQEGDLVICLRPDGTDWLLGSGGFGRVYKGLLHGSTPVAIKFVTQQSHKEQLRFVSEIQMLKSLRHTNIMQFLGAHITEGQIILASEFMPRGDLWTALAKDSSDLRWHKRGRQIVLDIARGLVFMHSKSMIHLDLKSSNVLLGRDGLAKIADVGLARLLTRGATNVSCTGTFEWAAPEILMAKPCSEKADIYSLGVIMWEIITGEQPHFRNLRAFRVPEEVPQGVANLALACRAPDPQQRPYARELFEQLVNVPNRSSKPQFRAISSGRRSSDTSLKASSSLASKSQWALNSSGSSPRSPGPQSHNQELGSPTEAPAAAAHEKSCGQLMN